MSFKISQYRNPVFATMTLEKSIPLSFSLVVRLIVFILKTSCES